MATGFVYIVRTAGTKDYIQGEFCNVPTEWGDRLYFGPCKKPMRPKMKCGDYVFGISKSKLRPTRILFAAKIEECITFAEAHKRFPELKGPQGPIHVCPIQGTGSFPASHYKHIPGSMHAKDWQSDLATPEMDAFFVCCERMDWQGRWLGVCGPEIDNGLLDFLKTCSVHGLKGPLSEQNIYADLHHPIRHLGSKGFLYAGLHLETNQPEALLKLLGARTTAKPIDLDRLPVPKPSTERSVGLGCSKSSPTCG
jgi:hypothetical protein